MPIRSPSPKSRNGTSVPSGLGRAETLPGQRLPNHDIPLPGKRTLLDKFRRHKGDKHSHESLKNQANANISLRSPPAMNGRPFRSDLANQAQVARQGSIPAFENSATAKASNYTNADSGSPVSKKEGAPSKILHSHGIFPKPKRGMSNYDKEIAKERQRSESTGANALFSLDTNLDDMEGIVDPTASMSMAPHGGIFTGEPIAEEPHKLLMEDSVNGPGAWDAPDSWAVKRKGDENLRRLREIDEAGIPQKIEDDGTPHCVRIFRIDSTFATLSMGVNTTASEILQVLGKKSFLQDDLDNYQIIIQKHDLHRQLAPGERPIAIQKRLLEQAGYHNTDRIEEIGREDNSYLCRFTFVPTKLSGYYSLDKEPGHGKLQKFSHVDLAGRSLVTIPITLYQKATEIISLNLSRNLALDVPKDFIQSCNNLREIRYISNEAWQLPASISLATRLTVLDISNNRLEQLEHAELDRLPNLMSIKMSNNKLRYLPRYFGQFKALRSLNVSSNYIEVFPDFICDLKSLVDLDLSFNTVRALPKIGQLTTLERLWATNNMLHGTFHDGLRHLQNLKEVDIRFNAITNIDIFTWLPRLEQLLAGHNQISKFEGSFERIRLLHLDHNPMTRFDFKAPVTTLTSLNLASAKIAQLDDSIFERIRNVTKLMLDKNHFSTLSNQLYRLQKLEYLSMSKNPLSSLPSTIGSLHELRFLDIRECNLKKLPSEIWFCYKLTTLNVSSNVLETFPKPATTLPETNSNHGSAETTPIPASTPECDEFKFDDAKERRPSQSSALLSVGSSPQVGARQGSIVSIYGPGGRKASVVSRTNGNGTMTPISRKDSNLQQRFANTFASSLTHLYLADNRLTDDIFDEITMLPELRLLNLSYNDLYDIPQRSLRRWPLLNELYLSGNSLTSLPSDDLEQVTVLKVLHLNGNNFQVLPAELGKVHKLAVLDVGSNLLKYNVSNWPYDWNWNWNRNLKYLNFSGNKRLEIKPSRSFAINNQSAGRDGTDLTNFTTLHHLRVLGLMDVTLTIPSVPDETEDRRVRTSGSLAGIMPYGMADSLGRFEHLSTIDMVIPKFRSHETETLLGMFDGQAVSSGGSRLAKYLHENFEGHFIEELSRLRKEETPADGLRKTFLALNKDLATVAGQTLAEKEHRGAPLGHRGSTTAQTLSMDDLNSGGVATVAFFDNMELYMANVGDAQAMLVQSDGNHRMLTRKHEPADRQERERIREAGGYVSRHGKLNEQLEVSRAFGYIQMMPAVMAAPNITHCTLKESDEIILIASKELWDYMSLDMVVDVARSERTDLMSAAQKLRDLAMAFGATGKLMVMMIGVSELKRRERQIARYNGQSLSMVQSQMQEDQMLSSNKRKKAFRDRPDDSTLQRLDPEVEAPTGELSMVFTDIKSSTTLWENYPVAMRSAIKLHNEVMRRQLRVIGGYEVKTEGDAFVVSFPTATSALLWCFVVQQHLLDVDWPPEILNSIHCQEVLDADDNRIYRGLSVRMGAHWGSPVCEPDPVTRRMDYFGPMVNRSARISGAADGGQIYVSSDFVAEIHRALEAHADDERSMSTGSMDTMDDDPLGTNIRKELRALSTQGFEVKDLGLQKLKGLENPELIYLMYPHSLSGRLIAQQQQKDAVAATASIEPASLSPNCATDVDIQYVWDLWSVSLRLEMLCSALESPGQGCIHPPEKSVLERMKNRGGEVTDRFLIGFLEHQVTRIEVCIPMQKVCHSKKIFANVLRIQTCISTLALRSMVTPFHTDRDLLEQACPMDDVLGHITAQLAEFKALKAHGRALDRRPRSHI